MRQLGLYVSRLNRLVGRAAMHIYLIVALLSVYEVVLRYLFHAPTTWSYEIVLALCGTAWALSGGYVTLKKRHIAITVLYDIAPPRIQRILDVVALAAATAALSGLVYLSFILAEKALRWVDRSGSAFNSPLPTLSKCLLLIGAVFYLAQVVSELVRAVGRLREGGK